MSFVLWSVKTPEASPPIRAQHCRGQPIRGQYGVTQVISVHARYHQLPLFPGCSRCCCNWLTSSVPLISARATNDEHHTSQPSVLQSVWLDLPSHETYNLGAFSNFPCLWSILPLPLPVMGRRSSARRGSSERPLETRWSTRMDA